MIGLGTIANSGAIVLGGLIGALFGKKLNERYQQTITRGMAVAVMFVGISGTLQEMLKAGAADFFISLHMCSNDALCIVLKMWGISCTRFINCEKVVIFGS